MKKLKFFGLLWILLLAPLVAQEEQGAQQEKENKKQEHDFSGYMEAIESAKTEINEKQEAYKQAMAVLYPKVKEEGSTTVVLATYEKKFAGDRTPYFFREYLVLEGEKVSFYFEKTVMDSILEGNRFLGKKDENNDNSVSCKFFDSCNGDKEGKSKTIPLFKQRILELNGNDANAIKVIYRSTLGSNVEQEFSKLKKLRTQIDLLNQMRANLVTAARVMDSTIARSEAVIESVRERTISNFGLQP